MKKVKKFLSLLAVCAMVLSLIACGSKEAEETTEEVTEETEETTEESGSERTEITIAISGSRLPYSLKEGDTWTGITADYEKWDEEWTGIEAEMWKEIISRTGWKLNIIQTDFTAVFGELDAGRADLAANHYSENEERLEKYYASVPWSSDPQVVIVAGDKTDINTFEDLRGAKIAVTSGQSSQTLVDEVKDDYDWEVVTYEGINGYEDVMYGRVDALAGSAITAADVAKTNNYEYHYLEDYLEGGNVVYFAQKTEEGQALLDELNPVIEEMIADGTVSAILEKWLYDDMTKYIVED